MGPEIKATLRKLYGPGNGITWVFHADPGEPCEACRLNLIHYPSCNCGHCPADPGVVMHRRLSDVLAEKGLI
jgi:hypothetical protein